MKLTVSATFEKFNSQAYMDAVREQIRVAFMVAGRRFLTTAVPRIPIWTGMARGAFRNAEDLFGQVSSSGPKRPVRIRIGRGGSRNNTPRRTGYFYYPPAGARVARTPQQGRVYATPSAEILQLEGKSTATGRTAMYFKFAIDITYFTKLDNEKWQSFKEGGQAVADFMRDNIVLPDPTESRFMVRKTITVT